MILMVYFLQDALYILSNASFFLLAPETLDDPDSSEDHSAMLRHCEHCVVSPMTTQNCLHTLQQIDRLSFPVPRLRDRIMQFIVENYEEIATNSTQLLDIPDKAFREIQIQFNLMMLRRMTANAALLNPASLSGSADGGPGGNPLPNFNDEDMMM
jgi:hypothetical protein